MVAWFFKKDVFYFLHNLGINFVSSPTNQLISVIPCLLFDRFSIIFMYFWYIRILYQCINCLRNLPLNIANIDKLDEKFADSLDL